MSKVTIKWNDEGFKEILNGDALKRELLNVATNVSQEAGDGFEIEEWQSNMKGGRPAVSVKAETYEAKEAEATDKVLTKAVQKCRIG